MIYVSDLKFGLMAPTFFCTPNDMITLSMRISIVLSFKGKEQLSSIRMVGCISPVWKSKSLIIDGQPFGGEFKFC